MNLTYRRTTLVAFAATFLFCLVSSTFADLPPIVAGQHGTGPGEHLTVPFVYTNGDVISAKDIGPISGHWQIGDPNNGIPLFADPSAPPMDKWFLTPSDSCDAIDICECSPASVCDTVSATIGGSAILGPGWGAPVWENFFVYQGGHPDFPNPSPAITDWHEHIHEPGWEWAIPPQTATESLITRDGEPWPWKFIDPPAGTAPNPAWLWVEFEPIGPGHVLDIHKELVWRGTPGNTYWGDGVLDDGNPYDETMIAVSEYPTIPEPSSFALTALGLLGIGYRRQK
jgi:hypothetical protein